MNTPAIPEWFLRLVALLACAWPNWKPTEEAIYTFWGALSDLPEEPLRLGAIKAMRECVYPPTVAEWRKHAVMFTSEFKPTAGDVWNEMRRNRKQYSPYNSHEKNAGIMWTSEAVRRAAEAVGWTDMNWQEEQLPTIRAQFERYYNALIARQNEADAISDVRALDAGFVKLLGSSDGPRLLMGGDA